LSHRFSGRCHLLWRRVALREGHHGRLEQPAEVSAALVRVVPVVDDGIPSRSFGQDRNLLGQEWNTIGTTYGEPRHVKGGGWCGYDVSDALSDPALSYSGGVLVGDALLWSGAVHPDITAVRATIDGSAQDVGVHPRNGAGYYVIEVPEGSESFTVELLVDGDVVPGSEETRAFPERTPN